MEPAVNKQLQESLKERRDNLTQWVGSTPDQKQQLALGTADPETMHTHLSVLEDTIDKASAGTLGICSVCNEYINAELLEMDYTCCVCLEHLSPEERLALELELELAQTVQRSLLPYQVPETPTLETAAFSRPVQIISGDYFDFFRFQDGTHGLAIGDVAGHGVSASLHMASMQALLRSLIPSSVSPHEVLAHVNRLMIHNIRFANFMALFLASFNESTLRLTYSNAGHTPPILFQGSDGGDRVRLLEPTGAAIGLVEDVPFTAQTIQLERGDLLLMSTDGVTEAVNRAGEQFGLKRLVQHVQTARDYSVRDLIGEVRQVLQNFTGGYPLTDDVTIVACKVVG